VNPLRIEYCGEWYELDGEFFIGREADLSIDDNPYLHRRFLAIVHENDLWWIVNIGHLLTATVSDATGAVQAWLSPGAKLPIVFPLLHVMFSAGSTTYDFSIHADGEFFSTTAHTSITTGSTTMLPVNLTSSQRLLVAALSEHVLVQAVPGRGDLPSSADAAARLGWSMTTFNRKLDNVCDKLDKIGVAGLHGGKGKLATNRRARLVEYAIATRLVTVDDVALLDAEKEKNSSPGV
jgi:hypothetical protein